ncbi:MAG: hypothetical protein ACI9VS_002009 [Candidatus Binatia bacterium]|jgi:hypothetical protein
MKFVSKLIRYSSFALGALMAIASTALVAAPVETSGRSASESFHFAHDISPLLAKKGCAAAECHGSATGQGGFKLSLFAGDPRADYDAIRNELDGRRIDARNPEESLFLRKPARRIKHGGGRVFKTDDPAYQTLLKWIENEAPYAEGEEKTLVGIELEADESGARVSASFKSATESWRRDVTDLALLSSTNEDVAKIDESGDIELVDAGETWILARYGEYSARVPVRRSFGKSENGDKTDAIVSALDSVWLARMNELGLQPVAETDEATLLRRLYFDLAGRPPSPYEARAFSKLPREKRVETTVEKLLASREFDEVFGGHLARWFEVPEPGKDDRNGVQRNAELRHFFLDSVREKLSVAEIGRRIVTEKGPDQAWRHLRDPRDRAEYVGRALLGMSIACARCHNHPLDRWKQEEHLQFSAYFADPRPAANGGMMEGKFFLPGEGRAVEPVLLPLTKKRPPSGLRLEDEVAWFAVEGASDQLARNFANRIFGALVGKPLVESTDDHRLSNPAVHEPLLEFLAKEFQAGGTDLRKLVKTIVTSRIYALSSEPPSPGELTGDPELDFIARREARPLSSRQFKLAVESVLGVKIDRPVPPDSPLARQLYVMNSGLLQAGLKTPGNQVEAIFDFQPDPKEQLKELYQLILSRRPTEREIESLLPTLQGGDARTAGNDLAFALLASREFGSLR